MQSQIRSPLPILPEVPLTTLPSQIESLIPSADYQLPADFEAQIRQWGELNWGISASHVEQMIQFLHHLKKNPIQPDVNRSRDNTLPIRPPFTVLIDRNTHVLSMNIKEGLEKESTSGVKHVLTLTSTGLAMLHDLSKIKS